MLILVFVFLNRIGIPEFLSSIQIMAWKLNWYWIQVHDLNTGEVCNSDLFVYLNSVFDEPVTESIPERNKIIGKFMVWLLNGQMVHRWILLVHRYTITIQLPDFSPAIQVTIQLTEPKAYCISRITLHMLSIHSKTQCTDSELNLRLVPLIIFWELEGCC